MLAAIMTAANLGARVTGAGFVVFTVGSLCWGVIGYTSGQPNLLATNAFLTLVNLVGIWRWLGRQRAYEDGGRAAERASHTSATPSLFTATGIAGTMVVDPSGAPVGKAVEALIEIASGRVSYVVVADAAAGLLHETLRAVRLADLALGHDKLVLALSRPAFEALTPLIPGEWPASPSSAGDKS